MIKNNGHALATLFGAITILSLLGAGCARSTPAVGTATASPTPAVCTVSHVSFATPSATPTPSADIILKPGDFYFSVDGKQSFIFSRNITGAYHTDFSDFETFLDYAQAAGDRVVRLQIDNLGFGFRSDGTVDETWALKWDRVFDMAAAKGLDIIPEFGVWLWWSTTGLWKDNPLNAVNGGPAKSPDELFKKDSETQKLWIGFVQKMIERWQSRKNIVAWEIFSEINLASGSSNSNALQFVGPAAAAIRGADPQKRPLTVSVADVVSVWPSVNQSNAVDFLEVHPYPVNGQLDRYIIDSVGQRIRDTHKPILIGESGLTGITPDPFTHQPNAHYGIEHAMWADVVSGAMNGRALWDQDSYAIYWTNSTQADELKFVEDYSQAEVPAGNFVKDVDFAGFHPLKVTLPAGTKVWGAAVGNESMVLGWFRDAASEPPDWKLQANITNQTVTLTVPGSAANWQVDFYDTKTGTDIVSSAQVTRKGNTVTVTLPDFTDDIAFKMYVKK